VAVRKGSNTVLKLADGEAVGAVAKDMLGKTPSNIVAIRPLKNGVIADFDITEAMLRYFIRKVHKRQWFVRPRVLIAIPSGITEVEKTAVKSSAMRAGAREVYLIDEPMAAGIGIGLPVMEALANMVVDIGGGTTEVAIISLGGVVTSASIRVAGDEMDEAIIQHMKRAYNLMIGERTAEQVKIRIGSASPLEKEMTMEVRGRDLIAGLPRSTVISSEEIREALQEPISQVVDAVRITLENTQPELASDLIDRGITLVGGGSLLRNIDKVVAKETGLPVRVADDPMTAVARGTGVVLEQLDGLKGVLEGGSNAA
jgi:rod shape-determining protein MreB